MLFRSQNFKSNLLIRTTLEGIYRDFSGDRKSEDFKNFTIYLKRVWFCNGIHHHYSTDKIFPDFSQDYFSILVNNTPQESLPIANGQDKAQFLKEMNPLLFNSAIAPKRVSLDPKSDLVLSSSSNFALR